MRSVRDPLGRGAHKRGEACTSPERGPSLRHRGYPPPVIFREDLARGVAKRQHAQALEGAQARFRLGRSRGAPRGGG